MRTLAARASTEARRIRESRPAVALALPLALAVALAPAVVADPVRAAVSERLAVSPVLITEVAPGWLDRPRASFVELRNVSAESVDLGGWNLYRCDGDGLRAKRGTPDSDFAGVVLAPGEHYLIARAGERPGGATPDDALSSSLDAEGFGFVLEDPDERVADAVAVYSTTPWMTRSECDPSGSLPNILDVAVGESWQRFATSGDAAADFRISLATPGSPNRLTHAPRASASDAEVAIAEVAPFGPGGSGDDLVELVNSGDEPVALEGWTLWRCTASGARDATTLQATIGARTLDPGARLVIGGPASAVDDAIATMPISLADAGFGVQLRDARGALVDEVAVAHQLDSACQGGPEKLPATLDPVRGESWQLVDGSSPARYLIAPRTPGAPPPARADSLAALRPLARPGVVVSELATDPVDVARIASPQNFVELANRGDRPVALGGWRLWACDARGLRRPEPLAAFDERTRLAPGEVLVVALQGTAAAESAVARFAEPLDFLGAGVLLETADGEIADRAGAFHVNEMDESVAPYSVCGNGVSLVTFQPDRIGGESYHRIDRSGDDLRDFVTAASSPGSVTATAAAQIAAAAELAEPGEPGEAAAALRGFARASGKATAAALALAEPPTSRPEPARVTVGRSVDAPLPSDSYRGIDERTVAVGDAIGSEAAGFDYPYLRFEFDDEIGGAFSWRGTAPAGHPVRLSAWSAAATAWMPVAESDAGPDGAVALGGELPGTTALLVQAVPRTTSRLSTAPDGTFENPDDTDFAIAHITDTQYLAEGYPEEYERLTRWLADSIDERELVAAVHTGDLIQSWVDPDQSEDRARIEFERASRAQAILERTGLPSFVLPGNHDTKRGIDPGLYNEYFGPERFAAMAGYVAPIAPGDNTSNYAIVEEAGARMLILSIGYGYGPREIEWAERVVRDHPDANVVIATHEHLTPMTQLDPPRRASDNRWLSRADELWSRVVAPNRNVVAVLSGHYHGLGAIVTENAGGIPGHTVVEMLADYQEFRTDAGERATGFLRLLQVDVAGGRIAVDTYSPRLDSARSAAYDYRQFVVENGDAARAANGRPWNILDAGLNDRYGIADEEFGVDVTLQYSKAIGAERDALAISVRAPEAG